jgi:hypothetical protein
MIRAIQETVLFRRVSFSGDAARNKKFRGKKLFLVQIMGRAIRLERIDAFRAESNRLAASHDFSNRF